MYKDIIKEATGCTDTESERIEEFMRDIVFRSPLDCQTQDELKEAARLAKQALTFLEESKGNSV